MDRMATQHTADLDAYGYAGTSTEKRNALFL